MRWECGAPLWAWCCSARGTNCGKRWKATRRWRREGLHERNAERQYEASGRNDAPAVRREATGPHAGAGARIAAADARDAGRRRTAALEAGAIPGTGPQIHAMDLGARVWAGSDGSLRVLYGVYRALAAATGSGGIRGHEPAWPSDFSGHNVEGMAIHDDTPRGAGDGDAG